MAGDKSPKNKTDVWRRTLDLMILKTLDMLGRPKDRSPINARTQSGVIRREKDEYRCEADRRISLD
jgi:hypothetical protein